MSAKVKKGDGSKFVKKSKRRRPGRHAKKIGMKSGLTGQHHR